MAPIISPFSLKIKRKKQRNKQVSFGDDNVTVIERIPLEEQPTVWYNGEEMERMQRGDSGQKVVKGTKGENLAAFLNQLDEPSEEEKSHFYAKKLVKNISNKCRTQLEHADGYWDPRMAKELSKMSLAGSKDHRNAATKRAKDVYKEVYNQDSTKKSGGIIDVFSRPTSRGVAAAAATAKNPKFKRADTERTELTECSMTDHEDRPELMRSDGMLRLSMAS